MPTIKYPDVPAADGVPAVLRDANAVVANVVIAVADAVILVRGLFGDTEWGLFDGNGQLALEAESFNAVDIRKEYRVASHPIEEGQFQNYNKVEQPLEAKITYTHGGSVDSRAEFIESVRQLADGLDLFTLVTPEFSCDNMNVTHFDFSKKSRSGATLMIVDVWVEEIRQTEASQYTDAKDPTGESVHDDGTVTPSSPASSSGSGGLRSEAAQAGSGTATASPATGLRSEAASTGTSATFGGSASRGINAPSPQALL